jgi:2-oxo-3-hexenedioate decarboxylase
VNDAGATAAAIQSAFDRGRPIEAPGVTDGYAVARALQGLREARGAVAVGRKIGFTNAALMQLYGVASPIWGSIYDATLIRAAGGRARVAVGAFLQPKIEPEIQLHFVRRPSAGADEEAILACVDWVAHGFEIVHCPYPGWRFESADAIAAGSLHAALVLGPPVPVAAIADPVARLRTFSVTLSGSGGERADGTGADVLGSPLLAVAALELPPEPGEIISTGSLTAALAISPGQTWTTEIQGVELPGLTVELVE